MKKLLPILLLLSGCAYNRQYATVTETNTNGLTVVHTARSTTYAFGDTKSTVDKTRASAGKTASVGAAGVSEESSTGSLATNLNAAASLINALKGL